MLAYLIEMLLIHFTSTISESSFKFSVLCCLVLSLMKLLTNSTILNLGLMMMTMTQGSWLIHLTLLDDQTQMIYLYYSWHLLAVFVVCIILTVGLNFCYKRKSEKSPEEELETKKNLTDTVKKTINTFGELNMDIIANEKKSVEQKSKEDLEIINVLNSIDKMVNEQQTSSSSSSTSTEELTESEKSSFKERISPLEEFNTLFRNADCVRKSIKLKESDIV